MSSLPYHARPASTEDAGAIRSLFREVFEQDMDEALWHWKYANPLGRATLVFRGEQLVAHYGGMGRQVLQSGKPQAAVQITDVMVSTSARHSVRGHSPFALAFSEFATRYLGYGNDFPLAFGFPSDRHVRLAQHLDFYAPVGRVIELSWPARESWRSSLYRLEPVTLASFRQQRQALERAWARQRRSLRSAVVGVRDADWLRYRYLENPQRDYSVLVCRNRLTRAVLGVLVLRVDEERCLLMDAIGSLSAIRPLLALARAESARLGKASLVTWCQAAFARYFPQRELARRDLHITVPANIYTPGPSPAELQDRWWLMPGDTDFQ